MTELPRPKVWAHPIVVSEHVFDKLWVLDLTFGELRSLLIEHTEVIEERWIEDGGLKEIVLSLDWTRPLHLVVIVDDVHREERLITVYEPSTERWSEDFRTRR